MYNRDSYIRPAVTAAIIFLLPMNSIRDAKRAPSDFSFDCSSHILLNFLIAFLHSSSGSPIWPSSEALILTLSLTSFAQRCIHGVAQLMQNQLTRPWFHASASGLLPVSGCFDDAGAEYITRSMQRAEKKATVKYAVKSHIVLDRGRRCLRVTCCVVVLTLECNSIIGRTAAWQKPSGGRCSMSRITESFSCVCNGHVGKQLSFSKLYIFS
mmetsp:Transcript_87841/g.160872  ORF Transcript_87841/g.160872 Transcript_87841/m.160872 type:complete len:211 (-) Transcript_87841:216-848(-)